MHLREQPHCTNCAHFHHKRFHCKGAWKGRIHPEHAGTLVKNIDEKISLYHITCTHYTPEARISA